MIVYRKEGIMRIGLEVLINANEIPKDKNRLIMSMFKSCLESSNSEYFESLYSENIKKNFTFSLYMKNCKFNKESILIPDGKIYVNFSTYDALEGINFYNSFVKNKNKDIRVGDIEFKISKINQLEEKIIKTSELMFTTLSPIVVREHNHDNKKTWYHSLNTEKGMELLLKLIQIELLNKFGNDSSDDIEQIKLEVIENKDVNVTHYDIQVLSNLCVIKISAKPYILEYLYKSGIGSRTSQGFGMVKIV